MRRTLRRPPKVRCCRRGRFARTKSARERKAEASVPRTIRARPGDTIARQTGWGVPSVARPGGTPVPAGFRASPDSGVPCSARCAGGSCLTLRSVPERLRAVGRWAFGVFGSAMCLVLLACGCFRSFTESQDGDAAAADDAHPAPDSEANEDFSEGADGAACPGWSDPASGLCWQDPSNEAESIWRDAMLYCEDLSLGGYGDWRVPTIDELRSFIRGCPATEAGGACGVTDGCFDSSCRVGCRGCPLHEGPARG
jgi:hypothetical protein